MLLILRWLACAALSLVPAHLAGVWLDQQIKLESNLEPTLYWVSGSFDYAPGYRGGFPTINVRGQGLMLACPRNAKALPCADPREMRREINKGVEGFYYRKYKRPTVSSGAGMVVGLKYMDGSVSIDAEAKKRFSIIYVMGFFIGFALSFSLFLIIFKKFIGSHNVQV